MALAATPAPRPVSRNRLLGWFGAHPIGYLFIAPYVIFVVGIYGYPVLFALYMSFFDYFFASPGAIVDRPFVGLQNYANVLSDPLFHLAMRDVVIFVVINVPLTVVLALVLATALNGALPLRAFFRAAYYIPYVTASVAVISIWLWLFSGTGLVNRALGGLAPNPPWLVNGAWAMPIIAFYVTWKQLGFYVLLYLAALQNIPVPLYEAAKVDGAGRLRTFWAITVPVCVRRPPWWWSSPPSSAPTSSASRICSRGRRSGRSVDLAGPAHVPGRHRAESPRLCRGDRRPADHRRAGGLRHQPARARARGEVDP